MSEGAEDVAVLEPATDERRDDRDEPLVARPTHGLYGLFDLPED